MADCALTCSAAAAETLWEAACAPQRKARVRRRSEYPLAFAVSLAVHALAALLWLGAADNREMQVLLGSGVEGRSFSVSLVSLPGSSSSGSAPAVSAAGPAAPRAETDSRSLPQHRGRARSEPRASLAAPPRKAASAAADGNGSAAADGEPAAGAAGEGSAGGGGGAFSSIQVEGMAAPAYPPSARRRGEEGRVVYEVWVSREGRAQDFKLLTSSSYSALDQAALAALQKAVFRPALQNGAPVDSHKKVAFRFRLER